MSVGDPIVIERITDSSEWVMYMKLHCLNVNKSRSSEYVEAGGEQASATIDFKVRWHKLLAPVELSMPHFRIVYRGATFDIRAYDDFMYQHRTVKLTGVSHG